MQASLEARVARLERANRALGALAALVAVLAIVVACSEPATLAARSVALLDADGAVRAELALRDGEPGLFLTDANGVERVALFHDREASGLYVRDGAGVTRIGVAQFAHGGGGVALHGPESKGAAVLYYKQAGSLRFFDADGNVLSQVPPALPAPAQ